MMLGLLRPFIIALANLVLMMAASPAFAGDAVAAEARARAHIARFPGQSLDAPGHAHTVRDIIFDADGSEHVRFDRRYRGMPVIGGDMVVHSNGRGVLQGISKTLARPINVPATARLSRAEAIRLALAAHPRHTQGPDAALVVYARGDLPQLAFDVQLVGTLEDGTPSHMHVIVDAQTARVLDVWDDIHTAPAVGTGKGLFNGTVSITTDSVTGGFELKDPTRGNQRTVDLRGGKDVGIKRAAEYPFKDADNAWGNGLLSDPATVGVDAQYGTAVTWDYFKLVHGRNGIANNGIAASNRVHYGSRYNNAFWWDSCFCMTYGDGDGTTFNPFDSLDVAGHEMSHGVTSRTANLVYSGESGGLNESTSDIFGTMVEFYANNASDPPDYLIGEKLYKSGNNALRSMIQPSSDGSSADCWYSGVGSLNVHYSSGVGNHFFFLLAEGSAPSVYAPNGSKVCQPGDTRVATGGTSAVTGIGRDKAAQIWYRALTVHMTSNTNYSGARAATISAATFLYGAASIEVAAVAAAWNAVRVTQ